jgi:glucan phosphorylase
LDKDGKRLTVVVPIHDRQVYVSCWLWQQGDVPLYLLDTNVDENAQQDRAISQRLYPTDKETRLKQAMILGIGGIRLLEALNIHPSIYHLNEGHSAMLILDLVRHEREKRQVSFQDAVALAKRHIIFTNHTLVPSGHEVFSNDLVSTMLSQYAETLAVPYQDIVELGLVQDSSQFSLTMLALRVSARSNAVSKLHREKALEIWSDHPMDVVTNGVHIPTWDGGQEKELWNSHQLKKQKLLQHIAKQTGVIWQDNELLLGWARRIVAYKRPLALFEDLDRLKTLVMAANRPIRIVYAGFSPPGDTKGAGLLQELQHIVKHDLRGSVVYLPHYDLNVAHLLVSGCDVWLNTPAVGFEASGTSGMKAALNGVLPVSTKDGWVAEAELFRVGWVVSNDQITKSLLDTLERQVVPMYYDMENNRQEWIEHMKNARDMVINQFSATTMLRNYVERMYLPAIEAIDY